MRAFPEPRRSQPEGQSFVAFAYAASSFRFGWHYHPEFELTLIEAGSGTRFVGDNIAPFGPGDLVLLGGNLPHTWSSEGRRAGPTSHRTIVVHFPRELFALEATEFSKIKALLQRAQRGCHFPQTATAPIARELKQLVKLHGFAAWCRLASILDYLAGLPEAKLLASAGYAPTIRQGAQRRLERALSYIEKEASSDRLCLRDVARTVHLSPAAFSRFFRQMTGGTLVSHINQVRVGLACRRLSETDQSVTEIAYASGYRNLANFNRRFREIKSMTPTAFREHFKSATP